MPRTKPRLKVISLFSGCGGLDLGLHQAGFDTVFATDLEPLCEASYKSNFPQARFFCGSITAVTPQVLEADIGTPLPRIDLLAGGPPCPPFSKSRFYRREKSRSLADPVGLETFTGYFRILRLVQPRAFLLENVAGLAYGVHAEGLNYVYEEAKSLGYTVTHKVLNSADYGVPQLRERCIVIGTKSGNYNLPSPTHRDPNSRGPFERELPPWLSVGTFLSDLDSEENAHDDGHFAGGQHHDLLVQVPPGQNYLFFTKERGHPTPKFKWRSRYWSFLLKLSPVLPSWTIQARRSNNMGPFHWRNRILRIAEVKRIQRFPDSWRLAGTIEQQWRQIGNAVPPPLAKILGRSLRDHLEANP